MWIDRILASPTTRAVVLSASYAEQRHRVLAENVANIDTPDYHTKNLDPGAFQESLRTALERAEGANGARLELRGDAQVATSPGGTLEVHPVHEPAPNILFHDGTNARLEKLLTDVGDNALFYELSMNLLRGRYQTMLSAIRGRVS